jgi:hypothetical protein
LCVTSKTTTLFGTSLRACVLVLFMFTHVR